MTTLVHRKTGERVEGSFGGGGADGLFTFVPAGLPASTFSTSEWELLPDEEILLDVPLQIKDITGKLVLRESFGNIKLDGKVIDMTRSLGGLHFYFETGGYTEVLDINPLFEKWATDFLARAADHG